ncbi:MAG: alpha-L-fucosidase [Bryobacteraceae bacterium]|nr:MAG: alpha-L-fucosidase [Bryobacteraceae bacterium]
MKAWPWAFLLLCVEAIGQNFADIRPSPQQLAWQELEIGVLVHFGPNTFMDREWGDGTVDPAVFNPTRLDADQWVRAARAAGAKYLILVAKHHDGFCLWPSRHTDYSVRRSPWKNGQGDVVREVEQACRRHGLAFGIYLSPWDRHDPRYADNKKYDDYYVAQMTELATQYGPLVEFWLDGAGSEGHVYDFVRYVRTMRTYQPNALLFASLDFMPYGDIRWVGNESGSAHEENWNVVDNYGIVRWRPAEADTPLRHGHWFWHPDSEKRLKSLDELMDIYHKTVGRGAQLVLGIAPDHRGLLPEPDAKRLEEFGAEIRRIYGRPAGVPEGPDPSVVWLAEPRRVDRVVLQEDLAHGQMVRRFRVEAQSGGQWREVARGTTIGHKRILIFGPLEAAALRVVIEASLGPVHLKPMTVYSGGFPPARRRDSVNADVHDHAP